MDRVATRTNVAELLLAVASSAIIALLVLAGGAAIGEATAGSGMMAVARGVSSEIRPITSEHEEIRPGAYLCCALIYADSSADQ
jgi:hypothetical protein